MPRPIGSDRLEPASEGRLYLFARHAKGWRPRTEKSRLTPEHPGTAVRWEEQVFEVLDVDSLAAGEIRYTLALWDEQHAIRVVESYDEANETRLQRERESQERDQRHRWALLLLMPLLGLLPASEQEEIENRYAVPATRLTIVSAVPLVLLGSFCLAMMWAAALFGPTSVPLWLIQLGQYFWIESLVRISISITQGRPIGSVLGWVAFTAAQFRRGERSSAGPASPREAPSPERAAQDSFHLMEPFLSFLDAADQAKLKELFGFDGVRWGKVTAIVILVAVGPLCLAAIFGLLSAPKFSDVLLLAATGTLAVEQALRLGKLSRGLAAPSLLGFLFRPRARRLLGPSRP